MCGFFPTYTQFHQDNLTYMSTIDTTIARETAAHNHARCSGPRHKGELRSSRPGAHHRLCPLARGHGSTANATPGHLPIHASWLNQVEIYFSVVQRKVLAPNDFHTLRELETRLLEFQDYYQQIATPFDWRFTKTDLNDLLARISAHKNAELTPAA